MKIRTHQTPRRARVQTVRRPQKPDEQAPAPVHDSMFVTGGIGDILALDSFLSDEERAACKFVYYATRKAGLVEPIMKLALPKAQHIRVTEDFSERWCFHTLGEFLDHAVEADLQIPAKVTKSLDYGIAVQFHRIRNRQRAYVGSPLIKASASIDIPFALPRKYAVLCPYSTDKRNADRDCSLREWDTIVKYLERARLPGIVLNQEEGEFVPNSSILTNLSGQTTLLEAIAITCRSTAYIGIDSSMSVLAPKVLPPDRIAIKSRNQHLYQWRDVYYAPTRVGFPFVGADLTELVKRMS